MVRTPHLPADLQAGLELAVDRFLTRTFAIESVVIGARALSHHLARYGTVRANTSGLIALGAGHGEVLSAVRNHEPQRAVTLTRGALAMILNPVRHEAIVLPRDLPGYQWRRLGYARIWRQGFQGCGAISLIAAERVARLAKRPDLADRLRIGMQCSLPTRRWSAMLSTVIVQEYRRIT